jgi:hypothetical protein
MTERDHWQQFTTKELTALYLNMCEMRPVMDKEHNMINEPFTPADKAQVTRNIRIVRQILDERAVMGDVYDPIADEQARRESDVIHDFRTLSDEDRAAERKAAYAEWGDNEDEKAASSEMSDLALKNLWNDGEQND